MNDSFNNFVQIIKVLRGPDGCAWDRKQTLYSMKDDFLEEAYETVEAIENKDTENLKEELGDMLLHVVLHSQVAADEGYFNINDVIRTISDKIIRRHPHVFTDNKHSDIQLILKKWEEIKATENKRDKRGALDKAEKPAPPLVKAQKLQDEAAKFGFDWDNPHQVIDKLYEEVAEIKQAIAEGDKPHIQEEIGDAIFALANLARHCGVNAEEGLKESNAKFIRRFNYIHNVSGGLSGLSLDEMELLWQQAKKQ